MKAFFEAASNPFFDFSLFYYFRHFAYLSHLISQLAYLSNLSWFCCTQCVSVCVSSFLFNCQPVCLVDLFLAPLHFFLLMVYLMISFLSPTCFNPYLVGYLVHPSHHDNTETANPLLGGVNHFPVRVILHPTSLPSLTYIDRVRLKHQT